MLFCCDWPGVANDWQIWYDCFLFLLLFCVVVNELFAVWVDRIGLVTVLQVDLSCV